MKIIKNTFKTITETTVNVTGSAVSGIYEGLTTEEQRESARINRRIRNRKSSINRWAWLLFVAVESIIVLQFIAASGFENLKFELLVERRGIILLIPGILLVLVNTFSGRIAKETVR